jgi:hypothetical protein
MSVSSAEYLQVEDAKDGWSICFRDYRYCRALHRALSRLSLQARHHPVVDSSRYDYWPNITGLITANGLNVTFANLFRHNNEHIIVIPKLIYAANYLLTSLLAHPIQHLKTSILFMWAGIPRIGNSVTTVLAFLRSGL